MMVELDLSLYKKESINSPVFIDRVYNCIKESGISIQYGDYISKSYKNGHINVLKSLGLYLVKGRGANRKVFVHEFLKLIMDTSISSSYNCAKTLITLFDGGFSSVNRFENVELSEFNNLSKSLESRGNSNFMTYIMYNPENELYKIGRTKSLDSRLKQIKREYGSQVKLVASCDEDFESLIHSIYSEEREFGEWFSISSDDLLDITNDYNFKFRNK